ncbi:hypothetical protein OTU49_017306 [Cherax quadricarinatus]|uniref:Uncharacterized protein n=1 Tax=Cherax quadricarinatus TaxID=27406 RepID=A0AAW0Y7R3_CHEQU
MSSKKQRQFSKSKEDATVIRGRTPLSPEVKMAPLLSNIRHHCVQESRWPHYYQRCDNILSRSQKGCNEAPLVGLRLVFTLDLYLQPSPPAPQLSVHKRLFYIIVIKHLFTNVFQTCFSLLVHHQLEYSNHFTILALTAQRCGAYS